MRILNKVLLGLLVLALLYGVLLLGEMMTTQELKRATNVQTQEAACLMWKPHFLSGNGVCYLNLLNAQGKTVDTAKLMVLTNGFDALEQCGGLDFQGQAISVGNLKTGEIIQRFAVRNSHLNPLDH
jgi:hypothetical protein